MNPDGTNGPLISETNTCYFSTSECACQPEVDFDFYLNGCTVDFTAPVGDSYLWDFGDGITSTLQEPSHVYFDSKNYSVQLTTQINGTFYTCIKSLTPKCYDICEDEEFEIGIEMVNCSTYIFSPPVVEGCEVVNYTWDFGDGSTSELKSPEYSYSEVGSYSVRVNILCEDGSEYYCEKILEVSQGCFYEPFCGVGWHPESAGAIEGVMLRTSSPITVKVYISVLVETAGEGGRTKEDIEIGTRLLNQDFAPQGIFFDYQCEIIEITDEQIKEINDSSGWRDPNSFKILFNEQNGFNHFDGVDIFLAPEGVGQLSLAYDPIPSGALWIRGRQGDLTNHTLSHEMGHCLGLHHTFFNTSQGNREIHDGSKCELVNGTNGKIAGDYVQDTPAEPYSEWDVVACGSTLLENDRFFFTTCSNSDPNSMYIEDKNNQAYMPHTDNLMAYNYQKIPGQINPKGLPLSCPPRFTNGQGARMRNYLLGEIQRLTVVQPTGLNVIIETSQPWTNSIYIQQDLIIKNGATLSIMPGTEISFSNNSKLIIEPGGELELFGTLTSGCNRSFWEGIEVWGSASAVNQFPSGGIYPQGRIVMHPNSVIENAKVAAKLYRPLPYQTGGQIICNGAIFKNNKMGVEFAPFTNSYPWNPNQPIPYEASFRDCTFEVDDSFPHPGRLNAHVWLNGVDGIQFRGCKFSNNSSFRTNNPRDFGYGIFSNNSSFSVEPFCRDTSQPCNDIVQSEFTDMGYGVFVQEGIKPFEVSNTIFRECLVGVRNNGVAGGTLLFNDVFVGEGSLSQSLVVESVGFAFEGDNLGWECEENNFRGRSFRNDGTIGELNIGILTDNTGNNAKEIRRNEFRLFDQGNLIQNGNFGLDSDGISSGLLILCNGNFSNDNADIELASNSTMDWDQGLFIEVLQDFLPAGNTFSNTGISNWDGIVNGNDSEDLRYYIWQDAPGHFPNSVDGNVVGIPRVLENTCDQNYFDPFSGEDNPVFPLQLLQKYQNVEATLDLLADSSSDSAQNQRKHFKSLLDKYAYQILVEELKDSLSYSEKDVVASLRRFKDYQSELAVAKFYINQSNWDKASEILANVSNLYSLTSEESTDLNDFNYAYSLVNGKNLSDIDSTTLELLYDIDDIGGNAQTWVRNILTLHGAHYPLEIMKGQEEIEERRSTSPVSKMIAPKMLSVFPNPASDRVRFISASKEENQTLIIRNFHGKVLFQKTGFSENENVDWYIEDNPSGAYLYQLIANSKIITTGKIIVNK